jgi:hypothetical protein
MNMRFAPDPLSTYTSDLCTQEPGDFAAEPGAGVTADARPAGAAGAPPHPHRQAGRHPRQELR